MEVKLFDFDYTVYPGDSSFDFYMYCLRRKPQIIRFLPQQVWHWTGYMLGIEDRQKGRSGQYGYLRGIDEVDFFIKAFWEKNQRKIRFFGTEDRPREERIIISASPEFMIAPIAKQARADLVIATKVDKRTGQLISKDCYAAEKVARLRAAVGDAMVREAYSDSLSDLPMLQLADKAYIVRRRKVIPLAQYQSTPLLRRLFA